MAGGPRNLRVARDGGAKVTIDHTDADWADRVREVTGGTGVNLVFDGVGGEIGAVRGAWCATVGGSA